MQRNVILKASILGLGILAAGLMSCATTPTAAKNEAPGATVTLRDGTRIQGSVTASAPDKLTLLGADKITREIPTSEVQSVTYDKPAEEKAPGVEVAKNAAPAAAKARVAETRVYQLPAGTSISVRTAETIDSGKAAEGHLYPADVTRDIRDASGAVVIPKGADASIEILSASKGGRFKGTSDLALDLASVTIGGKRYELETSNVSSKGRDGFGVNKRTGIFTGGGAAVGAIIGGIADGGKGSAIGAGAGAGAGALTQILTKGGAIKVPAETVLSFTLEEPLQVRAAR